MLTPDLWPKVELTQSPFLKHANDLINLEMKKARGPRDGERGRGRGRGGPRGRGGDRGRGGRGGSRGRGGPRGGAPAQAN